MSDNSNYVWMDTIFKDLDIYKDKSINNINQLKEVIPFLIKIDCPSTCGLQLETVDHQRGIRLFRVTYNTFFFDSKVKKIKAKYYDIHAKKYQQQEENSNSIQFRLLSNDIILLELNVATEPINFFLQRNNRNEEIPNQVYSKDAGKHNGVPPTTQIWAKKDCNIIEYNVPLYYINGYSLAGCSLTKLDSRPTNVKEGKVINGFNYTTPLKYSGLTTKNNQEINKNAEYWNFTPKPTILFNNLFEEISDLRYARNVTDIRWNRSKHSWVLGSRELSSSKYGEIYVTSDLTHTDFVSYTFPGGKTSALALSIHGELSHLDNPNSQSQRDHVYNLTVDSRINGQKNPIYLTSNQKIEDVVVRRLAPGNSLYERYWKDILDTRSFVFNIKNTFNTNFLSNKHILRTQQGMDLPNNYYVSLNPSVDQNISVTVYNVPCLSTGYHIPDIYINHILEKDDTVNNKYNPIQANPTNMGSAVVGYWYYLKDSYTMSNITGLWGNQSVSDDRYVYITETLWSDTELGTPNVLGIDRMPYPPVWTTVAVNDFYGERRKVSRQTERVLNAGPFIGHVTPNHVNKNVANIEATSLVAWSTQPVDYYGYYPFSNHYYILWDTLNNTEEYFFRYNSNNQFVTKYLIDNWQSKDTTFVFEDNRQMYSLHIKTDQYRINDIYLSSDSGNQIFDWSHWYITNDMPADNYIFGQAEWIKESSDSAVWTANITIQSAFSRKESILYYELDYNQAERCVIPKNNKLTTLSLTKEDNGSPLPKTISFYFEKNSTESVKTLTFTTMIRQP